MIDFFFFSQELRQEGHAVEGGVPDTQDQDHTD